VVAIFIFDPKWSKLVTKTLHYPNQPSMAPDPESQTNADPCEYKSLQETDALLSLFYLMSDLIGPDFTNTPQF
jgi:hypothetical protein